MNFKSKMKKRLKFTMRNERQKQNFIYERQNSKDIKMININGIVSIVGINNKFQAQQNDVRINNDSEHKIIVTKPISKQQSDVQNLADNIIMSQEIGKRTHSENKSRKQNFKVTNYKSESSYSPSKLEGMKRNYHNELQINKGGTNNELNPNQLQPPSYLRNSAQSSNSDGTHSAGLRKCHLQRDYNFESIAPSNFNIVNTRTQSRTTNFGLKPVSMNQWLSESSSRIRTNHKMYKNNWTLITDWSGPRVCQFAQTKRIWMKRRQEMHNAPLIIIWFDGVIGTTS